MFKNAEHIVRFVNTEGSLAITSTGYAYFYFVLFFQFLNFSLPSLGNERWNNEQLFRAISTNFSHAIALIYLVSRRIAWISAHPEICPTQNRAVSICSKLVGNLTNWILRENTAILWFAYIGPNYTGPFLNARQSNFLAIKNFEVTMYCDRSTNIFKEKFKRIPYHVKSGPRRAQWTCWKHTNFSVKVQICS